MILGTVPIFCIVGGIFFGSFIVTIACVELKNIIKAVVSKVIDKIPARKKY
ncbi:hypothetical protein [Francisella sp. LA112445]|uniref:hypothetical protein n=1 Tax=Francisella sp. LA112445 TaxID=1395624 RepID=UPI001788C441|nr:hypothetical protein [Francisella sp. LA112445]